MMKTPVLLVGGTFNQHGGRPSKVFGNFVVGCLREGPTRINAINGGHYNLLNYYLNTAHEHKIVVWFADVPNDLPKLAHRVKQYAPHSILVTSKRNDNDRYTKLELFDHALKLKSNLFLRIRTIDNTYYGTLYDPLGNQWSAETADFAELGCFTMQRAAALTRFTRQGVTQAVAPIAIVPNNQEFFGVIRDYADMLHDVIHANESVTRFLGNSSFRCAYGFPSARSQVQQDVIYVSQRNMDKRRIDASKFVAVRWDKTQNKIFYHGPNKPSVDTPIQVRLYDVLKDVNYMLHTHAYIKGVELTGSIIPCGALEEAAEILAHLPNPDQRGAYKLNLVGHGSIVMSLGIEGLRGITYVPRPV